MEIDPTYTGVLLLICLVIIATLVTLIYKLQQSNKRLLKGKQVLTKEKEEFEAKKYLFEALFHGTTDGLALIESDIFIDCNQAYLDMYKIVDKKAFFKRKPGTLIPKYQPNGDRTKKILNRAFASCNQGIVSNHELLVNDTFGTEFWINVTFTMVRINERKIVYAIIRNVSDRMKLQEKIRKDSLEIQEKNQKLLEQKLTFEKLFYENSDGVALYKNNKFVDCNNAALEIIDCSDKAKFLEISQHEISPYRQPDGSLSKLKLEEKFSNCALKGSERFEWVFNKVSGGGIWVSVVLTKIVLDQDDIIYVVWRDINQRKKLEELQKNQSAQLKYTNTELYHTISNLEKLKIAEDKLASSEKLASLGALVAGVSHEVNTPLGVAVTMSSTLEYQVQCFIDSIKSGKVKTSDLKAFEKKSQDSFKLLVSTLGQASTLISSFKQVAVDQTSSKRREFNVHDTIKEVLSTIHHQVKQTDISYHISGDNSLQMDSYPGPFGQVLTNLFSNAIAHAFESKNDGEILIDFKQQNEHLVLVFKDNGCGIKPKNLSRIYEPFYTTKLGKGGSGLGLNIVHNIINELFEGDIAVSSDVNGSAFTIEIPLMTPEREYLNG